MKDYFKGDWSYSDLKLLVEYDSWLKNDNPPPKNLTNEQLQKHLIEFGNIGDTQAIKLFDDKYRFIFLSIDSGVEVIVVIYKNDLSLSQNLELN